MASFAETWLLAGGDLIAAPKDAWEDFNLSLSEEVVDFGSYMKISAEALFGLNPDLVIASSNTKSQMEMKDTLEGAGLNVLFFDVNGFEDYLRMLHQWYTEELIYPDFLSQGGADYPANDLFTGDKIGVWFTYVSYLAAEQGLMEHGTIAPMVWPSLEKGKPCEYGKAPNNSGVDGMGAFSVTTASDNIPLLCAIFNEFYTEEGYDFCNWGIEGETYEMEGDKHVFTDVIVNDPYSLGPNVMMTYYFFKDGPFLYNNERYLASYTDVQLEAANLWTTSRSAAQLSTMTTDQMYESYTLQSDISTVYQEYVVKFIVGDKDIDADWQEFMDQLSGCGLDRFLELGQLGVDQYADRLTGVQEIYDEFWGN